MVNCWLVICEFVKRCLIDAVGRSRGCLYTTSRPACFQVFLDPDPFGKRTQASTLNFPEMDTGRLDLVPSAPRTPEKWAPSAVCKGNARFCPHLEFYHWSNQKAERVRYSFGIWRLRCTYWLRLSVLLDTPIGNPFRDPPPWSLILWRGNILF